MEESPGSGLAVAQSGLPKQAGVTAEDSLGGDEKPASSVGVHDVAHRPQKRRLIVGSDVSDMATRACPASAASGGA